MGQVETEHRSGEQVHIVVFELAGRAYGVNVDQVEALTEGESTEGMCRYDDQDIPVQCLARWIGLDPPDPLPSRLLVSRSGGAPHGFLVDTPRDIVSLAVEDIFALPVLVQRVLGDTPLWGVGRCPDGLLPLVDLSRVESAAQEEPS
jgi:chemotaxis signal transduction protein